jgi:autotransporter-associated beta strand protein
LATSSTGAFQIDDPAATLTLSGSIGGNAALLKTGYGTLILTGSASYNGPTQILGGVLGLAGSGILSNSPSITVGPQGVLQMTNSGVNQFSSSASIALNGGSLFFYGNGSIGGGQSCGTLQLGAGENEISASLSVAGSNQPYLQFASLPTSPTIGSTINFSASGANITFQSNPLGLTGGILGGYAYFNGTNFATLSGGTVQAALAYTTTGDLGSLATSSTMNIEPSGLQTSVTGAKTINSLDLIGAAGVQMTGSGAMLTLATGGLIANTTGAIRGGVLMGSASGELVINAQQNITISSSIPNNGGPTALVITGPATVTSSGAISYSGDTYIDDGTLILIPPVNTTYGGSIHGAGNFTKSGTTTLTLTGSSDNYGTTTITGGGLNVNGTLGPNMNITMQSSSVLSGSGSIEGAVTVTTGGAIALSPSGSIAGPVTVYGGTLLIGKSGVGSYLNAPSGLTVTGYGMLAASPSASATIVGNVNYFSSSNSTYSGVISGTASFLTMDAPGAVLTLTNTAASSYGGVIVQDGSLQITASNTSSSFVANVIGGELSVNGSNLVLSNLVGSGGTIDTSSTGSSTLVVSPGSGSTSSFGGTLANGSGTLALAVAGSGTLSLSGTNTYTGGTTLSSGTLLLNGASSILAGSSLTIGNASYSGAALGAPAAPPNNNISVSLAPVPEPGSLSLVAAGLAVVGLIVGTVRLRKGTRRRFHV